MRALLTITFIFILDAVFGQSPTKISGAVVDENGNPMSNASIHFGHSDTSYTDKQGKFSILYPNPQQYRYYFYIEKDGYLPKSFFVDLSTCDITLGNPFTIRSRKGFWYNANDIDSSHLGMKVKDAIIKYKLDIDQCILWDEPPGVYHHFRTELGDSSYISIFFKGLFSRERVKMNNVLDSVVTGIGIGYTNGTEKEIGNGQARENQYFLERRMKNKN